MNWWSEKIAGNKEKRSIERLYRNAFLIVATPTTAKTDPTTKLASGE
jgi:hypothetical protein